MKTWSFGLLAAVLVLSASALSASAAPVLIFDMQFYQHTDALGVTVVDGHHATLTAATPTGDHISTSVELDFVVYGLILDGDNAQTKVNVGTSKAPVYRYIGNDGFSQVQYSLFSNGAVVGDLYGSVINDSGSLNPIYPNTNVDLHSGSAQGDGAQGADLNGNGGFDIGTTESASAGMAQTDDVNPNNDKMTGGSGNGYFVDSPTNGDANVTHVTVGGKSYTKFILGYEQYWYLAGAPGTTGTVTLVPQTGDMTLKYVKFESDGNGFGLNGNDPGIDSASNFLTISVVPEPATMALIGMGAMSLLGLRRRRNA